jgi:hypothetical protein
MQSCAFDLIYQYNIFNIRNPNEQQDNRDRVKLKNIEWTPYESVHKKFLNIGEYQLMELPSRFKFIQTQTRWNFNDKVFSKYFHSFIFSQKYKIKYIIF